MEELDFLKGKRFTMKAKNGRMVSYKIIDFQQYSPNDALIFFSKVKGNSKTCKIMKAGIFLQLLNEFTIFWDFSGEVNEK